MPETPSAPTSIRRLDTKDATRLARLVMAYDGMQTVLGSCERLMTLLGEEGETSDEVAVEALWTLVLLSYARAFTDGDGGPALGTRDLAGAEEDGEDVRRWHQLMLHLRDHHADSSGSPRESYTVGIAQDASSGSVNGVAVTSVRTPLVDPAAVRRAGAMAFRLCGVLDERIGRLQQDIVADVRDMSREKLERLDLVEVAPAP
ncbi:hypothetical protein DQ239_07605 [Blastococcus sp. TF02-09]|uniref:hypothetical protein n=1 Tax=Blastococcus sp. TF02-09 TaxID=2250576 RepID=UPI000DEA48E4|nr:hypothetical protein [Blastococcus sp. TF02-9]RBY78435.1 hypothetical protein DQ239_07605 [Blastococcus sp. TF02-9]